MSTITIEQQQAIAAKLANMTLPSGLGNQEAACSIAAINLALTGKLTDDIPPCMSKVVGKWIIQMQDAMPDDMRNSERWKSLLPRAAGTGRHNEQARLAIVLDWMWSTVLPTLQPLAHERGFGAQWKHMTTERTAEAAAMAAYAAVEERASAAWASADAASDAAAYAAADAADVAAADAADVAAAAVAWAAAYAAGRARADTAWEAFDPCGLLEKLIEA